MGRKRKHNAISTNKDVVFTEVTDLEVSGDKVEEVIYSVVGTEGQVDEISTFDYSERIEKPKSNRYSEMLKEGAEKRMKWKSQN